MKTLILGFAIAVALATAGGAAAAAPFLGNWQDSSGGIIYTIKATGSGYAVVAASKHVDPAANCTWNAGDVLWTIVPKGGISYAVAQNILEGAKGTHCSSMDSPPETIHITVAGTTMLWTCASSPASTCYTWKRVGSAGAADQKSPQAKALVSSGVHGHKMMLRYHASDDSGETSEFIVAYRAGQKLHSWHTTIGPTKWTRTYEVPFTPTKAGLYSFCVVAYDGNGNLSKSSCANVHVT